MNEEQIKSKFNKNSKDGFTILYPASSEFYSETTGSKDNANQKANEQSSFVGNFESAITELTKSVKPLMKELEELEAKRSKLLEQFNDISNLINGILSLIEKHKGGKQ